MRKWEYNEKNQAGATFSDIERAKLYDNQMKAFRNFTEESKILIDLLNITNNSNIIDFGCGTGELTVELAKACKNIYAIDVSECMLNILKEKAEYQNINNIKYFNSGFLTYNHEDNPVDIVLTKGALHHLPDFWKTVALKRIYDFIKPNGILFLSDVIFSFEIYSYKTDIEKWLNEINAVSGKELYDDALLHIKEEHSTFDWIMDAMLSKCGFSILSKKVKGTMNIDYICAKN